MKESYDRTGDVNKTLQEEAQKAKAQYDKKQLSGKYSMLYRYKGSGYWGSFYKDISMRHYRESTIQTITREWTDFFGDTAAAPDFGATSKERRA